MDVNVLGGYIQGTENLWWGPGNHVVRSKDSPAIRDDHRSALLKQLPSMRGGRLPSSRKSLQVLREPVTRYGLQGFIQALSAQVDLIEVATCKDLDRSIPLLPLCPYEDFRVYEDQIYLWHGDSLEGPFLSSPLLGSNVRRNFLEYLRKWNFNSQISKLGFDDEVRPNRFLALVKNFPDYAAYFVGEALEANDQRYVRMLFSAEYKVHGPVDEDQLSELTTEALYQATFWDRGLVRELKSEKLGSGEWAVFGRIPCLGNAELEGVSGVGATPDKARRKCFYEGLERHAAGLLTRISKSESFRAASVPLERVAFPYSTGSGQSNTFGLAFHTSEEVAMLSAVLEALEKISLFEELGMAKECKELVGFNPSGAIDREERYLYFPNEYGVPLVHCLLFINGSCSRGSGTGLTLLQAAKKARSEAYMLSLNHRSPMKGEAYSDWGREAQVAALRSYCESGEKIAISAGCLPRYSDTSHLLSSLSAKLGGDLKLIRIPSPSQDGFVYRALIDRPPAVVTGKADRELSWSIPL